MVVKQIIILLSVSFKFKEHNANKYIIQHVNITNSDTPQLYNSLTFEPCAFNIDAFRNGFTDNKKTNIKIANINGRLSPILSRQHIFISADVSVVLLTKEPKAVVAKYDYLASNFKEFTAQELTLECVSRVDITKKSPSWAATPHCPYTFSSKECGYTGDHLKCKKTLEDCKSKGNERRFGGVVGVVK